MKSRPAAAAAVHVSGLCCTWRCCWFAALTLWTVSTIKHLRSLSQGLSSNFHRDYWASEATCWKWVAVSLQHITICTTRCCLRVFVRVCLTLCVTRNFFQPILMYTHTTVNAVLANGFKFKFMSHEDDGLCKTNAYLEQHCLTIIQFSDISHVSSLTTWRHPSASN